MRGRSAEARDDEQRRHGARRTQDGWWLQPMVSGSRRGCIAQSRASRDRAPCREFGNAPPRLPAPRSETLVATVVRGAMTVGDGFCSPLAGEQNPKPAAAVTSGWTVLPRPSLVASAAAMGPHVPYRGHGDIPASQGAFPVAGTAGRPIAGTSDDVQVVTPAIIIRWRCSCCYPDDYGNRAPISRRCIYGPVHTGTTVVAFPREAGRGPARSAPDRSARRAPACA